VSRKRFAMRRGCWQQIHRWEMTIGGWRWVFDSDDDSMRKLCGLRGIRECLQCNMQLAKWFWMLHGKKMCFDEGPWNS
jgi:hypothetical protein